MPRALAVARVQVPPAEEGAYLAGAAALAAELRKRGQHLWVFRHPRRPGAFLEFRESAEGAAHTAMAPTAAEARLTAALRSVGAPDPGADELWLEVPLAEGAPSADRPA